VFRRTASVQTSTVSAVMHLLRRMAAERGDPTPEISAKMSETEMAILRLIARGYTNKEIAAALCSNDHAIRAHVKRIHRTLGARSNAHAVAIARDHGFTLPSGVFVARAGVERGS
jgi:DNA-binding NarL/FixJ family response regulator